MFSELIEEVTDWSVLTERVGRYVAGLSFHSVIVTIMMVFLALGAMGMLLALYRLDRMPSGVERGKLELPCRKDIDCRG